MGPQEQVERRLAAIFAADVEGYSRLMRADEVGTLQTLTRHRKVMDQLLNPAVDAYERFPRVWLRG